MKFYNDNKTEVTKFFDNERTRLVQTRSLAEKLTKLRGYFYEVYDENNNFIGYGIPK